MNRISNIRCVVLIVTLTIGAKGVTSLSCFSCRSRTTQDGCRDVSLCGPGQVCMLRRTSSNDTQSIFYESKCEDTYECSREMDRYRAILIALVGRKRTLDQVNLGSVCLIQCCDENLCNNGCKFPNLEPSTNSQANNVISTVSSAVTNHIAQQGSTVPNIYTDIKFSYSSTQSPSSTENYLSSTSTFQDTKTITASTVSAGTLPTRTSTPFSTLLYNKTTSDALSSITTSQTSAQAAYSEIFSIQFSSVPKTAANTMSTSVTIPKQNSETQITVQSTNSTSAPKTISHVGMSSSAGMQGSPLSTSVTPILELNVSHTTPYMLPTSLHPSSTQNAALFSDLKTSTTDAIMNANLNHASTTLDTNHVSGTDQNTVYSSANSQISQAYTTQANPTVILPSTFHTSKTSSISTSTTPATLTNAQTSAAAQKMSTTVFAIPTKLSTTNISPNNVKTTAYQYNTLTTRTLETSTTTSTTTSVITSVGTSASFSCPYGGIKFEKSCYMFPNLEMSFDNAVAFCKKHQGHLVFVNSTRENQFLKDQLNHLHRGAVQYWIGMTDEETEDIWKLYDTSQMATFYDWAPGEPDGTQTSDGNLEADCVVFDPFVSYQWRDEDCSPYQLSGPICEMEHT